MVKNTFEVLGDRAYQIVPKDQADAVALGFPQPGYDIEEYAFKFPELRSNEMRIKVTKSGLCASDAHQGIGEWGDSGSFPLVPGHETIGIITHMGDEVKGFEIGERVGYGVFSGACEQDSCYGCSINRNDWCPDIVPSYDPTWGGWCTGLQERYDYYYKIPEKLSDEHAAPLMCAGMTVYCPLRDYGRPGLKVGVVGIGGLGHMAIKYAAHMGMHVTAFSTTDAKKEECLSYGAEHFINIKNEDQVRLAANSLDIILVSATSYDVTQLIGMVKPGGRLVILGLPDKSENCNFKFFPLIRGNKTICGSIVGPKHYYPDMLAMSANLNILPTIEVIPFNLESAKTNFPRLANGTPTLPKYRMVWDVLGYGFNPAN